MCSFNFVAFDPNGVSGPFWVQWTLATAAFFAAVAFIGKVVWKAFKLIDRVQKELLPNDGGSMKDQTAKSVRQNRAILRDLSALKHGQTEMREKIEKGSNYSLWIRIKLAREIVHSGRGDLAKSALFAEEQKFLDGLTEEQKRLYEEQERLNGE